MRGEDRQDRPAITEALQTMLHDEVNRLVGLRTAASSTSPRRRPDGRAGTVRLESDPLERRNLAAEQPGLLDELQLQLDRLQHGENGLSRLKDQRMSPEEEEMVRQRLEALGYLE